MLCGVAAWFLRLLHLQPSVPSDEPILQWKGSDRERHPCLYVTARDVARIKRTRPDLANLDGGNEMDRRIAASLIGGDTNAEREVIAEAFAAVEQLIAKIPDTTLRGVGPHMQAECFGRAVGYADAALAGRLMTPEERTRLMARLAQAGYLLNDPDYWNPETGQCNFCPNMTSSAYGYRATIAALIPSHPLSKKWFQAAMREIEREMDEWTDPAGGMLECPHYSMVIFDQWVGACLVARHAGVRRSGLLFHPKLRKAIEWFGNISTPRDPRNSGCRRWPTLGHTYRNESTSAFGLMAFLWKDKDPKFAARMRWMHLEHGAFDAPGILSYYPAMMGYRAFLEDPEIAPRTPAWTSRCYPETGALLRNALGSPRETTLYLIGGRNHSHYYNDSGSITIWGKGRELCDDDSYQFPRGADSRSVHSMPDAPATFNEERVMALREFSASDRLDYVRGTRRGWQRQIAFVKDPDPLGPNYFFLADTFDGTSAPTTWRLFLSATNLAVHGPVVTVSGRDDVDMDLFFVSPGQVKPEACADHVSVDVGAAGTLSVILYPRLNTEPPPHVTPVAGGRGARVVTPAGTDYVFLSPAPFAFHEDGVDFKGKAGLVRIQGGRQIRSAPGRCDVAPGWKDGDRELRAIRWKGPAYPISPDE